MFSSDEPIYRQVAVHVADEILAGNLEAHDQVMSTNEFAEFFRINPATAAKGMNMLVDDGLLYKRRGLGMFVAEDARGRLLEERRTTFLSERLVAVVAEAGLLGVSLHDLVDRILAVGRATEADAAGSADTAGSAESLRQSRVS